MYRLKSGVIKCQCGSNKLQRVIGSQWLRNAGRFAVHVKCSDCNAEYETYRFLIDANNVIRNP